ncbi:MAG: sensor histidine kinase [Limisphaerales bacterium]
MSQRLPPKYVEGGFIALMILLCAILAFMQYRWTGEISRTEVARLRTGLHEPLEQWCRAFNQDLRESCHRLLPSPAEIEASGFEAAHAARFQQWTATEPRQVFARIAVAAPRGKAIELFELNRQSGRLVPVAWPQPWADLRRQFEALRFGDGPPVVPVADSGSALIQVPVFAERPPEGRRMREVEWMIYELDLDYLRQTWFPELNRAHLNSGSEPAFDVEVRGSSAPNAVLYSSRPTTDYRAWEPDATRRFFSVETNPEGQRRQRDSNAGRGAGRWTLAVRYHAGALEDIVTRARWRNLALAGLVNILIVAAAWMLARQARRSRQVAEMQMNFVASVSHELRTPLTVIRSAGHNLLKGVVRDPDRVASYSRLIVEQADRLTGMIEQVLVFSRSQKGTGAAGIEKVSVPDIVRRAAESTVADVERSGCKLELTLASDLPVVRGDANDLQRVFQNLISNAGKHGAAGGWIGVAATRLHGPHGDGVEICVADRGPGVPAAEQKRIFDPFFRGERARREQTRGAGLGLSVVREIIRAHGGTVCVESNNGHGARFLVRLPADSSRKCP